jgi:hypothetical protein
VAVVQSGGVSGNGGSLTEHCRAALPNRNRRRAGAAGHDEPELTVNGTSHTIDAEMRIVEAEIAVFDATNVRIRRVPFSPDNVKSALS